MNIWDMHLMENKDSKVLFRKKYIVVKVENRGLTNEGKNTR